jgi:ABC-type glycerol-3-phosphate transport system substrate-binding protein
MVFGLLSGCSGNKENNNNDGYVFVAESSPLSSVLGSAARNFIFHDGWFYFVSIDYDESLIPETEQFDFNEYEDFYNSRHISICRVNVDTNKVEILSEFSQSELLEDKRGVLFINIHGVTPDGYLWVTESVVMYDDAGEYLGSQSVLQILDESCAVVASMDMATLPGNHNPDASFLFKADSFGNIIISADNRLYAIDMNMNLILYMPMDEPVYSMITAGDNIGLYFLSMNRAPELLLLNIMSESLSDPIALPSNARLYNGSGGNDILYSSDGNLYSYNVIDKNSHELLNLFFSKIPTEPSDVLILSDETIIISLFTINPSGAQEVEMYTLTRKLASETDERTVLTLAVIGGFYYQLHRAVNEFNNTLGNPYYIEVIEYYESTQNSDGTSNITRKTTELTVDLLAGNVPDMIYVSGEMPIFAYIRNGFIEDLYPYLDNDPILNREMFPNIILKTLEYDGIMYRASMGFTMYSLVGAQSRVGDKAGWSIDEMQAALEEFDSAAFISMSRISPFYGTPDDLLSYAMCFNMSRFVDLDAATCDFDSDDFKKLLEFVKHCPMLEDGSIPWHEAFQTGEVLLMDSIISGFSTSDQVFFGEDINYIGFPNENGNICLINASYGTSISMTTSCKDKFGAWQFIRTLLSQELQDSSRSFMGGYWPVPFPTNIGSMEALIAYALDPRNASDFEDTSAGKTKAPTQDYIDYIMELIANAEPLVVDQAIMVIIYEEVDTYINGSKSLEETAKVIQSRVSIYLSEQYG